MLDCHFASFVAPATVHFGSPQSCLRSHIPFHQLIFSCNPFPSFIFLYLLCSCWNALQHVERARVTSYEQNYPCVFKKMSFYLSLMKRFIMSDLPLYPFKQILYYYFSYVFIMCLLAVGFYNCLASVYDFFWGLVPMECSFTIHTGFGDKGGQCIPHKKLLSGMS